MGTTTTMMDQVPGERERRETPRALTPAGIETYPAFGWVYLLPVTFALNVLAVVYIALHAG